MKINYRRKPFLFILTAVFCICMALTFLIGCKNNPDKDPDEGNTPPHEEVLSVLTEGNVRIQLLSDTLVRVEEKGPEGFEDRESYLIANRDYWREVGYERTVTDGTVKISTAEYDVFVKENATSVRDVQIKDKEGGILWQYEGLTSTNVYLPSPSDALDCWYFSDSPRIIPSEHGYSPTTEEPLQGWDFDNDAPDFYLFLSGGSYKQFCKDYTNLTGKSEMVSLQMLGYWDSRWYAYSAETALKQIEDYRDRGYSIDVLVIDTDWRKSSSTGGVGYEINTNLFPDMAAFLEECHEMGINIVFNDHPEPVKGTQNGLEGDEVEYRSKNLTMILSLGLDYWWYDRNWGVSLKSCDPDISVYAFGMYCYQWITQEYLDSITDIGEYAERALIMANVDGCLHGKWNYASDLTAHRYSIQWTGDIGASTDALAQEIYAAVFGGAEVGLPYVSSDIGGHNENVTNDMYVRWMQYGALSTICRVHCTSKTFINQEGRMPWLFGETAEEVTKEYIGMRYRLLPVYYNLARENYDTGLPIMRRTDIEYPQYAEASRNDQYLLGENILVAPLSDTKGERTVFIPDGVWIDVWTGKRYAGPQTISVSHGLMTSPIFVREGAVIPLARDMENTSEKKWNQLALDVYPGKDTTTSRLYEDDTTTQAYKDGKYRTTDFIQSYDGASGVFKLKIGAAQGQFDGDRAFKTRSWRIRFHAGDLGNIEYIKVNGEIVTSKLYKKSSDSAPFTYTDSTCDSDVAVITFSADVYTESIIEFKFANNYKQVNAPSYDKTALPFTLTSDIAGDILNLTEAGNIDWAYFGAQSTQTVRKNISKNLIGSPVSYDKHTTFSDAVTAVSWTDGKSMTTGNGITNGIVSQKDFSFTINTAGQKAYYVVYASGYKCTAKFTVRDRAGNVKTITLGNMNGKFSRRVIIYCDSDTLSELYITYSVLSCVPEGQNSPSNVALTAVYVADKLPDNEQVNDVKVTAEVISSNAPAASVNLSTKGVVDWEAFRDNGTSVGKDGGEVIKSVRFADGRGFSDYSAVISWSDGDTQTTESGTRNGTCTPGDITITLEIDSSVNKVILFTGAWRSENTVYVYDRSGELLAQNSTFNAGDAAETRAVEIELNAEGKTRITIVISSTNGYDGGNVSLAALKVE